MGEFKFSDSIEETSEYEKRRKMSTKTQLIIMSIVAVVVGLSVFLISYKLFGPKKEKEKPIVVEKDLDVMSSQVKELYNYVTYGTNGERYDKFVKEEEVDLDKFTNTEKFYYALQFCTASDFKDTGKVDDKNNKIYTISSDLIKRYMKKFFGEKVTYVDDEKIDYTFPFQIDGKNTGTLTYDLNRAGYVISFISNQATTSNKVFSTYVSEVGSATSNINTGAITINESILFSKYAANATDASKFDLTLYKDYKMTELVETKSAITKDELTTNPIDFKNYKNNYGVITYLFNKNYDGNYYFVSSEIK